MCYKYLIKHAEALELLAPLEEAPPLLLLFPLSPEDELFLQFESLRSKNKFLEDNKYNFTFIMDQPRSETVFNNLKKKIMNVLSSVSCKLDTRIPNKFWPFLRVGQRHKISPCII